MPNPTQTTPLELPAHLADSELTARFAVYAEAMPDYVGGAFLELTSAYRAGSHAGGASVPNWYDAQVFDVADLADAREVLDSLDAEEVA